MAAGKEAIGLFGGSFDPVHNGHLSIARSFLDSGYISALWILLTPNPPHKIEQSLTSYELRLQMLKRAFAEWEDVTISDIEDRLPNPSYTVQTVRHLAKAYPGKNFYLCIGEDSAHHFTSWHRWREILSYCELLVAHRPYDKELELDPEVARDAHVIDHKPINISSTEVRNLIQSDGDISGLVPASVQDFIHQNNPY
ncbi:nicotinate (nicotinamide) nucleotide adenylyltransferase [Fodinibius halophilus]|uniref:Probable nicotinate-nucleotide adenylyltransferase n=1 Tax=Fodinibius halophilus TaxID=1736908 RepID=A0A6M1T0S6_9BACT|nr:nicotinate (nicotinamide) nucleotide adenylyltransferase [Fodinibius halophilus]NGP89086.1 nicotinate (nicotinamide) nucleotide adenylyltransferase [Fodinibius halophilus]